MSDKLNFKDIFDLLSTGDKQPVAAIYMTYGFDAQLFESHVLPAFLGVSTGADDFDLQSNTQNGMYFRNQIAMKLREVPITVFSDGDQYSGGRSFLYDHIVVRGRTFHPKCYLLLFSDCLRVVVTSANLTIGGMCYNAEILWQEDVYFDQPSTIAGDLLEILLEIEKVSDHETPEAAKVIQQFLSKVPAVDGFPKLISTCGKISPFDEIVNAVKDNKLLPKEVTIVSPFYEKDREAEFDRSMALSFANHFPKDTKINLYFPAVLQNGKWLVNAPQHLFSELSAQHPNTRFFAMPAQWELESGDMVARSLHGKLISVRFDGKSYLTIGGSVNFTERAMRSNRDKLLNVEIGVMEMSKQSFPIPESTQVNLSDLEVIELGTPIPKPVCFVVSAELAGTVLTIQMDPSKSKCPYKILYQDKTLTTIENVQEQVIFQNFKLKRSQDIEIKVDEMSFFVPITIMNKSEYISDDLEWDFTIGFSDVIDFLSGRYRSMSELRKTIKVSKKAGNGNYTGLYFRQNLQRYFKAMDALTQSLEQSFYTEFAFKNYLTSPAGLQKLTEMILEDYRSGSAEKPESFLFISELLQVLLHLHFVEDVWVSADFKKNEIRKIIDQLLPVLKVLYSQAKGLLRQEFTIICDAYEIEVK